MFLLNRKMHTSKKSCLLRNHHSHQSQAEMSQTSPHTNGMTFVSSFTRSCCEILCDTWNWLSWLSSRVTRPKGRGCIAWSSLGLMLQKVLHRDLLGVFLSPGGWRQGSKISWVWRTKNVVLNSLQEEWGYRETPSYGVSQLGSGTSLASLCLSSTWPEFTVSRSDLHEVKSPSSEAVLVLSPSRESCRFPTLGKQ